MQPFQIEERRGASVLWLKGATHRHYEDRYRLLGCDVPLVAASAVGEVFAVADGVGNAPLGMSAAQHLCDRLAQLYGQCGEESSSQRLLDLLVDVNREVHGWGFIEGTDRPAGACAATVVLLEPNHTRGVIAHAGDTRAALIRDGRCQILTSIDQSVDGALRCYFGTQTPSFSILSVSIEFGDRLLLVSDGVTKSFGMAELAAMLESQSTRRRALQTLGQACVRRASGDDATAMIIDGGDA